MSVKRCSLVRSDGTRVRVGRRGVLIGRGAGCDIVVLDARTSATHAMVWLTPQGPELIAFGRNPTRLDGVAVEGACTLVHGAIIDLPGERLRLECSDRPLGFGDPVWVVASDEDRPYSVYRGPVSVGGGPVDDLRLPEWPVLALILSPLDTSLALQFEVPALCNGEPVEAGEVRQARIGDEIRIGHTALSILDMVGEPATSTHVPSPGATLQRIRFAFLPQGGELSLAWEDAEQRVRFSEIRSRLVAALLTAQGDYRPGDWLPDDLLIPLVWPREPGKDRTDINTVLHRVRRDLIGAGIDAFALIERDTGATRFIMPPGVQPEIA